MTALFQVGTGHQRILVQVLRRERPEAEDYWQQVPQGLSSA
jgi:hypothetical protein